MTGLRVPLSRFWGSLTKRRREAQLTEEIQTHLDLLTDEFIAQGLSREEARLKARREFGGVESIKDSTRDERGLPFIESWLQDIRYALRQLRRQPGFASAAILTLAIGVGAVTGIFSIVEVVMLRPLPYPDADRLVVLHERLAGRGDMPVSPADADVWKRSASSFEDIALLSMEGASLTGSGEPEQIPADRVSPSVFRLLGVRIELGRLLIDEEDAPGRDRVVVISNELWRRRLNGDRNIVGTTVMLDSVPHEVVGVLARGSRPIDSRQLYSLSLGSLMLGVSRPPPQLWRPLALTAEQRPAIGNYSFASLARLKPGVTIEHARSELEAVQANLLREAPTKGDVRTTIVPLHDQIAGRSRAGLQLLFLAVAAVLLIGCANIANLLLARALVRRREMAVRQALGAGRKRLIRQLLVENLTLCALGGLCSLVVAYAIMRFLVANAPPEVPRLDEVAFDIRILLFTFVISVLSALLIGLLPAWRLGRVDLTDAMKARTDNAGTRATGRIRSLLVSSQIGISAACLVAAGLLLQSFVRLLNVDTGFKERQLAMLEFNLPSQRYPDELKRAAFIDAVISGTQSIPGVLSASASSRLPLTGPGANSAISREGTTVPVPERPLADVRGVTLDYFRTIGIPLRAGRLFQTGDRDRLVAVLSANLAEQAWPGLNPLGQRFRFGGSNPNAPLYEVVGVVEEVRNRALDEPPTLTAYVQYPQRTGTSASLLVHSAADLGRLSAPIRGILRALDPALPLPAFRTLNDVVSESMSLRRFQLQLVLFFAAAAALLAALGVYGLMAYAVAQRTNEFGVRLALGARPYGVLRLVLRDAARLIAGGLVVAIPVVLVAGSTIQSFLFGVTSSDAPTLIAVGCLMAAAGLVAAYVPGRRASQIEPMLALRCE